MDSSGQDHLLLHHLPVLVQASVNTPHPPLQYEPHGVIKSSAYKKPQLWNRIGFNADTDPAFYLNADPDPKPDTGKKNNADPYGSGSWSQTVKPQRVEFLHEIYMYLK